MATVARLAVVRGRVQGVSFRDVARREATTRGVVGWVRNREDGAVEAWLQGEVDAVDALEGFLREGGPSAAEVDSVEVDQRTPDDLDRFEVRP